jgi:two-component system phosphate regulon sensor histidine kinase PhoR
VNGRWRLLLVATASATGGAALGWWLPGAAAGALAGGLAALAAGGLLRRRSARPAPAAAQQRAPAPADGLAELLDPLAEGVALFDTEQRLLAANAAAEALLGRPLRQLAGATLVQALRDHDVAQLVRARSGELTDVHVSGTGRDAQALALPVGPGGTSTLLLLRDETELARARRARTELVAHLSHELRTPLAAARAVAETLQDGVADDAERERFLARLVEQIDRLGAIVDRLLRLARLESGQEPFTVEPLDAARLLAAVASRIAPIAERREVRVVLAAAGDLVVRADRERVLEVLSNLLDNAIRYSPQGGAVELGAARDAAGTARLWVRDEGPGVLPSERERIFERFYTGDAARASGGGAGLGLAIARQIVQRLGGRIWAAEEPRGARICFTLPLAEERE